MSDIRFTMLGIGLTFAGFIILGVFGAQYVGPTLEQQEFGECFEYFEDAPPRKIECEAALGDKPVFFAAVITLIGAGIIALLKGVKGKWDQDVKPQDMLGPGHPTSPSDTGESKPDKSDSD